MSEPDRNSTAWLLGRLAEVERTCADGSRLEPATTASSDDAVLDRLRRLGVPASGRDFALRLRYAVRRRAALRSRASHEQAARRRTVTEVLRVAGVAAVVLGAGLLGDYLWGVLRTGGRHEPPRLDSPLARSRPAEASIGAEAYLEPGAPPAPAQPEFIDQFEQVTADVGAESVLGWLGARNEVDVLRAEFRERFSREGRRAILALTGAAPGREHRIQELAADVARGVEAALAATDADPVALALGLRALLAAGSSRTVGENRHLVCEATDRLLDVLATDPPAEVTASLLAAVTDMAVVSDGRAGETVRRQAERLARATIELGGSRRPPLLQWHTRLSSLADAGYVLRLAPAFGAPAALCVRARRLVLAHLRERLDVPYERPDVVAAMLYGFGDLVDHRELDVRLLLWGARQFLPDYVALLHYAWGHYPVRRGWANFQDDLRYLSTLRTPDALADASALLLTLATNFAAPFSQELLARR